MKAWKDVYFGTCDNCGCKCGNKQYGWMGNTNVKIKQAYIIQPFELLENVKAYICEDCLRTICPELEGENHVG